MSSTKNRRIALMMVCLSVLFLASCAENKLIDDKKAEIDSSNYLGGYSVGKSSHDTLYTDHISTKKGKVIGIYDDVFIQGSLYVDGRVFEKDAFEELEYSTSIAAKVTTLDRTKNVICDPTFQALTSGKTLLRCDVNLRFKGIGTTISQTTSASIHFAADSSSSVVGVCPFSGNTNCYADGASHQIAVLDEKFYTGTVTEKNTCEVRYQKGILTVESILGSTGQKDCELFVVYHYYVPKEYTPPAPTGGGTWGAAPSSGNTATAANTGNTAGNIAGPGSANTGAISTATTGGSGNPQPIPWP